ncbi:MAG: hypothetical protein AB7I68_13605 [Porticoccaceae bacterium]
MKYARVFGSLLGLFLCHQVRSAPPCDPMMQLRPEYDQCLSDSGGLSAIIKRAKAHELEAIKIVADYYLFVDENRPKGEKWLRKGAKYGSSGMAFTLGALLVFPDRGSRAKLEGESLLRPLAVKGDLDAQKALGTHMQGQGNKAAGWWFERAAWSGDTVSMANLADTLAESSHCWDRWQASIWYEVEAKVLTPGSWAEREAKKQAMDVLAGTGCPVPIDPSKMAGQFADAIKAFEGLEGR